MYYVIYDLEDNYIAQFDTQRELAIWFGKTLDSMQSSISRLVNKKIDYIRSKDGEKYKIYKMKREKETL